MEFLGKIGIDLKLFAAQIVNFGLLLWFLDRFLYRSVIDKIERDEKQLDLLKVESDKLQAEKKSLDEEAQKEAVQNKERAEQIIREAEEIAKKIEERAGQETAAEKQKVIAQIRSRLTEVDNAENKK